MSAIERNILTVIEPTIALEELKIPDIESGTENSNFEKIKQPLSKFYNVIPLIRINKYEVQADRLNTFELFNTSFYPTCRFSFYDVDGFFTARFFPKDGDIIQVYIRSAGDEQTFKPIRIDFTIEEIIPLGGGGSTSSSPMFSVEGRMNIPNLFTERVEYYDNTGWNSLLDIAENLGLGFASNVDDTNDNQVWINSYNTPVTFIQNITSHLYLDDNSFFTSYIDPYYYLTVVEVNRMFDQINDTKIELSSIYLQNAEDTMGAVDSNDSDNIFPNILTNKLEFQGSDRYMSKYQQINNSGEISKTHGYKRYTQYWDLENKEFISEFVDPIVNLSGNLIPLTKAGRLVDGTIDGERNDQIKYAYLGTQGDNVHDNYMYSEILNYQNLIEINKSGMIIETDSINPAIIRFSRIYCLIVEYASSIKNVLTSPNRDKNVPTDAVTRTQSDDNIENDTSGSNGIINEYLSGFYVITGVEYFLTKPGGLRQRIHLRRREAIPTT